MILHLREGVYFGLDEIGARVWALLQRPLAVAEICAALLDEYEVDADRCERAVLTLLREMEEAGLIEVTAGSDS